MYMTKTTITTRAMRNIIPTFLVRRMIVSATPRMNSVVTSPSEVMTIIAMSILGLLPCTDLKYRITASSASSVTPEATTALRTRNAATSITKYIDRVLIIHGALTASSLSDNQDGGAACWRLIVLPEAYLFTEQVYSIRGYSRFLPLGICNISS